MIIAFAIKTSPDFYYTLTRLTMLCKVSEWQYLNRRILFHESSFVLIISALIFTPELSIPKIMGL